MFTKNDPVYVLIGERWHNGTYVKACFHGKHAVKVEAFKHNYIIIVESHEIKANNKAAWAQH